jgi:GTP-binding protein
MPEYTEKLFLGPCDFFWASSSPENLPEAGLPEIAFAGRSNVGKSSLINALLNRKALARTSSTPGRTQELIFFNLGDHLTIVDMPGYGYAKVSKTKKASWDILIRDYLRGRTTLRCAFILVDARHGLKDIDRELMKQMDSAAVSYRIVLTKADKAGKLKETVEAIETDLKKHPAAYPSVLITSAEDKKGLDDLRAFIISFLEQ